jgi:hypothetical protein
MNTHRCAKRNQAEFSLQSPVAGVNSVLLRHPNLRLQPVAGSDARMHPGYPRRVDLFLRSVSSGVKGDLEWLAERYGTAFFSFL